MFKNHLFDVLMAIAFMAAVGFSIRIGSAPSQLVPSASSNNSVPAVAPALTKSENPASRVYQYDPDSDAFTWLQFPSASVPSTSSDSGVPAVAPAPTTSENPTPRVYQYDPDSDAFTWFQFPSVSVPSASNDNSVSAIAPAPLTSENPTLRIYQYDPDSDAFTWFQFSSPTSDQTRASTNSMILPLDPMTLGDNGD